MTLRSNKVLHWWTCPCGTRNPRANQKCTNETCQRSRPKRRVTAHARALRDETYETFERVNREIHGAEPDACGVCGRPPKFERRHDRDHDHITGNPRGLACPGNQGCNALMPRWLTAERAQAIADYLRRVADHYAE